MRYSFLVLFFLAASCGAPRAISKMDFELIPIGEKSELIEQKLGAPYEIKEVGGKKEYIYIERIPIGGDRLLFRRYIFIVGDGKLIDKKIEEQSSPSLRITN